MSPTPPTPPTPGAPPPGAERIVAGVDDDGVAKAAIRWAADEAVRRGAHLELVHAWQPVVPLEPAGLVSPPANIDLEAGARALLDEVVAEVRAAAPAWPEQCSTHIVEGPAGPVLVEQAEGAALVVVGKKKHSALTEVLLGSVSRHVIHHAPCPVVVVR